MWMLMDADAAAGSTDALAPMPPASPERWLPNPLHEVEVDSVLLPIIEAQAAAPVATDQPLPAPLPVPVPVPVPVELPLPVPVPVPVPAVADIPTAAVPPRSHPLLWFYRHAARTHNNS
jgi:hypothetical protein